jgi:hypothetical protein
MRSFLLEDKFKKTFRAQPGLRNGDEKLDGIAQQGGLLIGLRRWAS